MNLQFIQLYPASSSSVLTPIFSLPPYSEDLGLCHSVNVIDYYTDRIGIFNHCVFTRVGTLIVRTIYLQLIQNRYMFRSFTVLQCSKQHCVQPVASDVEVVGYL